MTRWETNRQKVVSQLKREGWQEEHGGAHDKFKHPHRKGRIILPRHKRLSLGVAIQIAKQAGWIEGEE